MTTPNLKETIDEIERLMVAASPRYWAQNDFDGGVSVFPTAEGEARSTKTLGCVEWDDEDLRYALALVNAAPLLIEAARENVRLRAMLAQEQCAYVLKTPPGHGWTGPRNCRRKPAAGSEFCIQHIRGQVKR